MPPGPIPPTPYRPGLRRRTFSPTELRVFADCPERYYRQYIGKEKVRAEFSRATLRGSAVHKVLAHVFSARRDGEIIDDDLRFLAERFLPQHNYKKAGAFSEWPSDVDSVVRLAETGLARVHGEAAILEVETSFSHWRDTNSRVTGAELIGKVDLVYRHPEGFIEQIEFKTGFAQPDPFQQVICRIGVREKYYAADTPLFSTTVQLTSGEEFPLDGDRSVLRTVLTEIEEIILQIWNAETWPARDNDRCHFCNYRNTLCSLKGEWSQPNRLLDE